MSACQILAWFTWDPPREAFRIPFFDHPVVWYGILFVTGFVLAYFVMVSLYTSYLNNLGPAFSHQRFGNGIRTPKEAAYFLTDRLCWFVVLAAVIGARLGAVFFYDWPYFREHPLDIFKVWQGGLASHGGTACVFAALFLYLKYAQRWIPQLTFLQLLDLVAIPSPLVAGFIRLGNFMNQEIIGNPTQLPWGIIFGHPADGSAPIPRHPVQLYESLSYFAIFLFLYGMSKRQKNSGSLIGWMFILIFGSRFILEFWKSPLDSVLDSSYLQIGQLLSIPFILLGFFLLWLSKDKKNNSIPIKKTMK